MQRLRTGSAIFDVLVRAVAIALIAAIFVWILGILDAPSVVGTIIWILALLAIAAVIFPLAVGGASAGGTSPGADRADPTAPGGQPPAEEPSAPLAQTPADEATPRGRRPPPAP